MGGGSGLFHRGSLPTLAGRTLGSGGLRRAGSAIAQTPTGVGKETQCGARGGLVPRGAETIADRSDRLPRSSLSWQAVEAQQRTMSWQAEVGNDEVSCLRDDLHCGKRPAFYVGVHLGPTRREADRGDRAAVGAGACDGAADQVFTAGPRVFQRRDDAVPAGGADALRDAGGDAWPKAKARATCHRAACVSPEACWLVSAYDEVKGSGGFFFRLCSLQDLPSPSH